VFTFSASVETRTKKIEVTCGSDPTRITPTHIPDLRSTGIECVTWLWLSNCEFGLDLDLSVVGLDASLAS